MAEQNQNNGENPNQETGLVEYEANGEMVKLSIPQVKKYLVSGGGNVTDGEVLMFMSLCRYQHLNPFLKEAYLIKYGNNDPAAIVTGKDVFTKRADKTPTYLGKSCGVIVLDTNGNVVEREGALVFPTETLIGGWAKIFIKGHEVPEYAAVSLEEYIGRKKNGEVNSNWTKRPATMIRKVAIVQALREAFPDRFQGMYAQEEFADISDVKHDIENTVKNDIYENANSEDFVVEDIEVADTVENPQMAEPEDVAAEVVVNDEDMPDFLK